MLLAPRTGSQRPSKVHLPGDVESFAVGDEAVEFAESVGYELDDWQQWLVRWLLAERVDGSLAASTAVILVSRQNGKNVVLEVVELYGLCVAGLRRQVHSAHKGDTAAEHMKSLRDRISDPLWSGELGHLTVYESNGKERIVNRETRGELTFNTRTASTKRGASPQRIVFDEALFLTDDHMQAMTPSLAAQSMSAATSPQVIVTSSAPLASSLTLQRLRAAGLSGVNPRMLVADWGCDPGCDYRDRGNWYASNPGLGVRISEEFLESQLSLLTSDGFAQEHLGVVFGPDAGSSELPGWGSCFDAGSVRDGPASFAVDVAGDLSWTSIAAAGRRSDGLAHVEVIATLPGTAESVAALTALWVKHRRPVHVDPRSAAAGLLPGLAAAGVEVVEVGGVDVSRACAGLRQAVADGLLRHRGQGPLDVAVAHAAVRAEGDAWRWARRSSSVDISPLVAVTLAHAALMAAPVGEPGFYDLADFLDLED